MKSTDMSALRGRRVGQCWYSATDYDQIKAAMEDGHRLPSRYEEWLAGAEQRENQARSAGTTPVRVAFDLAEFKRFCAHFGVPLNSDSRVKFAAIKVQVDAEVATASSSGVH